MHATEMLHSTRSKKPMLLLVYVPALSQHGDQTVHSTHPRLRCWPPYRPHTFPYVCSIPLCTIGAAADPLEGQVPLVVDMILRWEDMFLSGAKFWRVKKRFHGSFQSLGYLKKILQKKCYRIVPSKVKGSNHVILLRRAFVQ